MLSDKMSVPVCAGTAAATCPAEVLTKSEALREDGVYRAIAFKRRRVCGEFIEKLGDADR